MSESSQFPQIPSDEVFKRLNAGTQVITPNRRLALALKEKFNQEQIARKAAAWCPVDVLSFAAVIERCYTDALYSGQSYRLPLLLSSAQEQVLWESIIRDSAVGETLLRIPQTAQWVREAWQLAHAWRFIGKLSHAGLNEDQRVFLDWAQSYRKITARNHQIDQARLCDLITNRYDALDIGKPAAVICYGFDVFTPQQIVFLRKLADSGCSVMTTDPASRCRSEKNTVQRFECVSSQDEIYQAAAWARDRLEANPMVRIGIVVPELANCRSAIIRIFNAAMHPDVRAALPGAKRPVAPFNVSLGLPLTEYPLIDAALTTLELVDRQLDYSKVSHWLRSPFLVAGESEMGLRALLDARCRQYAEPTITLERLVALMRRSGGQADCPRLWQSLTALLEFRRKALPEMANHTIYARILPEILRIVGFPGERALDSVEYQTVEKWHSLIAQLATLDHVNAQIGYREVVGRLKRMAHDTLFQPETPNVPIQILGVLEAAGMEFDRLWVMDLSDENWPMRARPNPFLPFALQRDARSPLGSTQEALTYCRKLTEGWLASARETIFSSPQFSDDRDGHALAPSPLIETIPQAMPVFRKPALHRDKIVESAGWESVEDNQALPLNGAAIKGGTAVLKDYAACSFRAWARHRLAINRIVEPHAGLDAMERGMLVHQVLAQVWSRLKTKTALDAIEDTDLERMLEAVADDAIAEMRSDRPMALSGRMASIERRRLVKLVKAWLDQEKKRDFFTVIATEEKRSIEMGDLHLNARLDRVDELENGRRLVIDYKTRKQSVAAMFGERPDEPQLPLYLTMTELQQQAAGVAFAAVKSGEFEFAAVVRDDSVLPGVKAYSELNGYKQFATWDDLLVFWRQNLMQLAEGFCSGDARVNPKKYPLTCAHCDLQLLCRIYERLGARAFDSDEDDD